MEEACDYSTYFQRGFAEVMLPAGVLVNHQQTRVLEAAQSCGVGSVGVHHDLGTIPCCATVILNIDKIRAAAGEVAFLIRIFVTIFLQQCGQLQCKMANFASVTFNPYRICSTVMVCTLSTLYKH